MVPHGKKIWETEDAIALAKRLGVFLDDCQVRGMEVGDGNLGQRVTGRMRVTTIPRARIVRRLSRCKMYLSPGHGSL